MLMEGFSVGRARPGVGLISLVGLCGITILLGLIDIKSYSHLFYILNKLISYLINTHHHIICDINK